ncbi:MAG: polysaccharide biosynthesis protein [Lawsonibacter sp.]|nr:polysaccharide biosynthesis protein [Lawsonibacter sp.]
MAHQRQAPRRAAQHQNTFFGGAAILAVGIFVVKIIGMFYKIPLLNIIGEEGSADFTNAYNIYAVLLTISTAGLPVAVSKLVSEANALGRKRQVDKIFGISLGAFLLLGTLSFLVMFFRADQLAALMNDSLAAPGIRALAPAVICVGCLAALRGYAQGHSNMTSTSVSQIIEALCKLVVGLALAAYVMRQVFTAADLARYQPGLNTSAMTAAEIADAVSAAQTSHAAAGAIVGVTVGTIVALVYMVLNFVIGRMRDSHSASDIPEGSGHILTTLLKIAIPITLSSSMVGIVTLIDSSLVQGQLQNALNLSENASRALYGNYAGALNIYNLPTSLMAAITASVIPAVSGALAKKDKLGAARITGSALRITALMAFPMGVGLFVLGTPIMPLLFPSLNVEVAGSLLSTLGLATPFVCMMLVCNSVLQAHGFVNLPVMVMVLGGVVKIVNNYNLVALIGISGAPVGNILCFGLCLALDLIVISRVIPNRPKLSPIFAKPLAASVFMGGAAWAVYGLLFRILSSTQVNKAGEAVRSISRMGNAAAVLAAIAVAMAVYVALVVALHAISRDDLALMPKGEKLARLLRL